MVTNKNIHDAVQNTCASLVKIQDKLMEGAWAAAKSEEKMAWQDAETLFSIAKEVNSLRQRLLGLSNDYSPVQVNEMQKPLGENKKSIQITSKAEKESNNRKKSDYPKYQVRDNCLVKIGLQRNRRTEYHHIVQKAAFDKIASVIADHLIKNKEFAPENVKADLNFPGYQIYVVLAMLRKLGILKIPRRGIYTAINTRNFVAAASDVWNKLSSSGMQKNDNY